MSIRRSHVKLQKQFDYRLPSESTRSEYMDKVDYFPETLEEDVVSEMVKRLITVWKTTANSSGLKFKMEYTEV